MAKELVLRKRQLAQNLVTKTGCKLKMALALVDFVFDEIATSIAKGIKVNVRDFGIFKKVNRPARTGRNPATGEMIKIKASVKPRFTPGKVLKEATKAGKYAAHDTSALTSCCAITAKAPAAKKPVAKKAAKKAKR
jgi:DNA-binding protein HU-beta